MCEFILYTHVKYFWRWRGNWTTAESILQYVHVGFTASRTKI